MNTKTEQELNKGAQSNPDEIELKELFSIIWKGKWAIIIITFVFAVSSVGLALYLPEEYKATAVVQPNEGGAGGKLSSISGQFGGLASLAGINLGATESSDALIAMEVMKSWGFSESFIQRHNIEVELFAAKEWLLNSNRLVLDTDLYSDEESKWVRDAPYGKTVEPTSWELYKELRSRVSIEQNSENGLVSVSVTYYSPHIAKQWVDWLLEDINAFMKKRALEEADRNIDYLEQQFEETSYAELRKVFSELIQEEQKNKMLAQVSDEYIFKTISPAKTPEERAKPNRVLIAIGGTLLGGFLSIMIVLIIGFARRN